MKPRINTHADDHPGTRWSGWASHFAAKYGSFAAGRGAGPLVLASPHGAGVSVFHREIHNTHLLVPHIHLAIAPVIGWERSTNTTGRSIDRVHDATRVVVTHHLQEAAHPGESWSAMSGSTVMGTTPTPLRRTLSRLSMQEEVSHTSCVTRRSASEVTRITRQAERTEERQSAPRVVDVKKSVSVVQNATGEREHQPLPATPARPGPSAPVPLPSVDALTDQVMRQIDRRMTSWRERRGRM